MKLTAEQHAVLHGHEKRLLYHQRVAYGRKITHRAVYECKPLEFLEVVEYPPLKPGQHRRGPPKRTWHLDGDNRVFRTLGALADAIHDRRKLQALREQLHGQAARVQQTESRELRVHGAANDSSG